ncbi:MAG TPA: formate dehydrogenase accessory sulfurtransferase FdhD [Casimicrobiaceae bacterium]
METARPGRSVEVDVVALDGAQSARKRDEVAGEEPLEIRLVAGGASNTLAITMRTPGNDFELAAGFVYGEAVVRRREDLVAMDYCIDPQIDREQRFNIVNVELSSAAETVDISRFERHFVTSSACGVCGRAQIDSLRDLEIEPLDDGVRVPASLLYDLPQRMREGQRVFASTGGLHAAALFNERGELLAVREDVGRHNAVDKIAGWALLGSRLPLDGCILMVSGRAGYEIVQKSVLARIPIVCSVSAPSSLAVELAREFNVTLVGFLRGTRANVYTAPERVTT